MKKLIFLIILLAAFLRLVTLEKLLVFTPDEEYLLYLAQTLVKDFHIIWIGVSALGLDFYMGPFWIYIIYPFVAVSKGDPLVLGVMTSILGVLTTFLIYFLGKKIFSEKVGLAAALFYALSALVVYYDQQPYPPAVPLLSLLMLLSLYKAKYSNKWWLAFAFFYGMVFHIHLSLTLIILVAIYWAYLQRKLLSFKIIILSFLVFLLTIFPLIAFDYFHKASNITAPLRIVQSVQSPKAKLDIPDRFNIVLRSFSRLWYLDLSKSNADEILYPCNVNPEATTTKTNWILAILTLGLVVIFLFQKTSWQDQTRRLLICFTLAFLVPFLFLSVINPVEYYLLGFFPILFLIVAYLLTSLPKNISLVLLILFSLSGVLTVLTAKGDYGLAAKKILVSEVMEVVGSHTFDLEETGHCHGAGGWRYLFSTFARKPEQSSEDQVFGWLYPDEISQTKPKYSVIIKETRVSSPNYSGVKTVKEEGGFTAYIFEN